MCEQNNETKNTTTTTPSTTQTINQPAIYQYGWVCPKCGRVNAPWKGTCDCSNTGWYVPLVTYQSPSVSPYNDYPTTASDSTSTRTSVPPTRI